MDGEINQNEIIANIALGAVDRLAGTVSGIVDNVYQSLSVSTKAGFRAYRKKAASNYENVRTILHRDRKISLREIYVPTSFVHAGKVVSDNDVISKIVNPCKILVQGTAGGGKTVFMRLVNYIVAKNASNLLPIFVELKDLNSTKPKTIINLIEEYLSDNGLDYSSSFVSKVIAQGRAVILLDGFDEIDYDRREEYALEIADLCKKFANATFIISSRPEDVVSSIAGLNIYKVNPFTKNQAVELLKKLPYEDLVRNKFISSIDDAFYKKHKTFLSNPLLITMMLMTYQQLAEVPDKEYLFYQNAFSTLFSLHDSAKEVYKRKIYTMLPIDEFGRVFSYFCYDSYTDQKFSFSEIDVRERLRRAVEAELCEANVEDFLKDLLISVCLIQKDGVDYTFVHRSFQEYFAALYINRLDDQSAKLALESICRRSQIDLVFPMVYAMNPSQFERAWAIPSIKAINKKLSSCDLDQDPYAFAEIIVSNITIYKNNVNLTGKGNIWSGRFTALQAVYGSGWKKLAEAITAKWVRSFSADLKSDEMFAKKVYNESMYMDKDTCQVIYSASSKPETLLKHVRIDDWSRIQMENLRKLESDISDRVKTRKSTFKAASVSRLRRRV